MTFVGFIVAVGGAFIALLLATVAIMSGYAVYADAIRGRIGKQLESYLYSRGMRAEAKVHGGTADAGHIRDLLDAAVSGSIPATMTLAKLTLEKANNRANSITWLKILQRSKPRQRSTRMEKENLIKQLLEHIGEISDEEDREAAVRCENFYTVRNDFRGNPLNL